MTHLEDMVRVLRLENEVLRNRVEFLEAQLEIKHQRETENHYDRN